MTVDQGKLNYTENMEIDYGALSEPKFKETFLLCNDGYFKGVLVRLKTLEPNNITLKVYVRYLSPLYHEKFEISFDVIST